MKTSYIRNPDGDITHVRETNGSESRLYDYEPSIIGALTGNEKGECVEVADHHDDGTTTAYEYDGGFFASILTGNRGDRK